MEEKSGGLNLEKEGRAQPCPTTGSVKCWCTYLQHRGPAKEKKAGPEPSKSLGSREEEADRRSPSLDSLEAPTPNHANV